MKCRILNGRKVGDVAEHLDGYPSIFIVADRNAERFAEEAAEALAARRGFCHGGGNCLTESAIPTFLMDTSEEEKSMASIMEICRWLLESGADRNALVLAIGGGITTDMAGFAASIYKRGVRCAYIPTTFLAQVDAAIGGKTGVNFLDYKNILGVIRQPEFTFVCPEVLETLPYRDFLSGAAELLKTFIIDDTGGHYEKAVAVLSEIHESADREQAISTHLTELEELADAAARIKAGIVERDEFEQGERRKLNLGHTFAHAIEHEAKKERDSSALSGIAGEQYGTHNGISHGEAVAIGTILAARAADNFYRSENQHSPELGATSNLSKNNGHPAKEDSESSDLQEHIKCDTVHAATTPSLAEKLADDFASCGLPTECPFPVASMSAAMQKDKKAENGSVHFILPYAIGDVRIESLSVPQVIDRLV